VETKVNNMLHWKYKETNNMRRFNITNETYNMMHTHGVSLCIC